MISRRDFLKILVSSGAWAACPFEIAAASDAEVEGVWPDICSDPIVFVVEDRTIYAPWAEYPQTYGDVVELFSDYSTREGVLAAFDENYDLQSHFYNALEDAASVEDSLAQWLTESMEMDDAVIAWLKQAPVEELSTVIDHWLGSDLPVFYEMPLHAGPMGEAYAFFQNQDISTLRRLGISVVEGEHPGSSYYAAELRLTVESANNAAVMMDLPIRFKEV